MACETPVVCSDILGFRDVVKHEREALMFHCGDRDAWPTVSSGSSTMRRFARDSEKPDDRKLNSMDGRA
jgi:hypothetical protein